MFKLKRFLIHSFDTVIPLRINLAIRFHLKKCFFQLDDEILLTKKLNIEFRNCIDIGSNIGVYTYFFSKLFKHVYAFEPIKEVSFRIKLLKNVTLYNCGLSNIKSTKYLNIYSENGMPNYALSSLNRNTQIFDKKKIKLINLDTLKLQKIDLIKIDVEGHEYEVIQGSLDTIKKWKPILIIEIEERHSKKFYETINLIIDIGYDCYFLKNKKLVSIAHFNLANDQNIEKIFTKKYINNFIFRPR